MSDKKGIELLSEKLVLGLFKDLSMEEKEVLSYGATILLSTLGTYLLLIFVSSLFNVTVLALTAVATSSLLRIFSGGVHASRFRNCALSGTIVFTTLGLIVSNFGSQIKNINILVCLLLITGSLIIYLYAPAEIKEKPITSQEKRARFKIYSFIVLSSLLLIYYIINLRTDYNYFVLAGLLGISWQLFTLTPIAYKLLGRNDNI
ncbi:accessory gene regulator ArgB-like protein [Acetohalobium arabaticum]|uniref:Accessory gene regulator B n=1 Tax=Acetohalobium arabaticum (strain ATCC 49924 / DSM 5501 / Z-7288) TaxID=574087 RepID=D9QV72_ACEAZ|nr:accessory gene regulator B family protein [Acetohalobium arabaticum]ADL12131.1 Accessory gene regulator B [Acetohalobium arabaticum DSM 5501]